MLSTGMAWWNRGGPAKDNLRTRVADLESDHRRIRAEWSDILDRLLRLDDRHRKRQERAEAAAPAPKQAATGKAALWARVRAGRANGTLKSP